MEDEEDYVSFGTPLESLEEDEAPKKRPVRIEDQVVTDEKGRRRFHGAFTGGFSAGYFNTVGTKEGWAPAAFVSSRLKKTDFKSKSVLDIMDDEDKSEHGISHQAVHVTSNYEEMGEKTRKRKTEIYHRSGPIPGNPPLSNLIKPAGETVGFTLLKKMGWKSGQGIGPRIKYREKRNRLKKTDSRKIYSCALPDDCTDDDEDDNTSKHTFAPLDIDCLPYTVKDNNFGLGYNGLKKEDYFSSHINLFEPTSTKAVLKDKSRLVISGQAFGVGAFEDDDEDIYAKDNMSRYDLTLGGEEKQESFKKAKSFKTLADTLAGFHVSSKGKVNAKRFPPLIIPKDFKPVHNCENFCDVQKKSPAIKGMDRHSLTISERSHMIGEKNSASASVFDLIGPQEKAKLDLAKKFVSKSLQSTDPPKVDISTDGPTSQSAKGLESMKTSDFKPFKSDAEKQSRYEQFVLLFPTGQLDAVDSLQPTSMTEWEREREKDEFLRAANLYRPLSGPMSSRFTSARHQDSDFTVEVSVDKTDNRSDEMKAAQMKMFGRMTRKSFEWHPAALLCKRFNIQNPYPGCELIGLLKVKKDKYSMFNFLTLSDDKNSGQEKAFSGKATTLVDEDSSTSEIKKGTLEPIQPSKDPEDDAKSINIFNSISTKVEDRKQENEEKPPVDFFKAIFASDESNSEDNSFSDENGDTQKTEVSSMEPTESEINLDFPPEVNPALPADSKAPKVASGVFANINFEKLNAVPESTAEKVSFENEKSTHRADENMMYGPALPPPGAETHFKQSKKKKRRKEKNKKKRHKIKKTHKLRKAKHRKKIESETSTSNSSDDDEDSCISKREKEELINERLKKIASRTLKKYL